MINLIFTEIFVHKTAEFGSGFVGPYRSAPTD
jgi:hypothetical protein